MHCFQSVVSVCEMCHVWSIVTTIQTANHLDHSQSQTTIQDSKENCNNQITHIW